jgi:hypothetical protein
MTTTEKIKYDCTQLTNISGANPRLCCQGCHRETNGASMRRMYQGIEVVVCCTYGEVLPAVPREIEGESPDYPRPLASHPYDCECDACEDDDEDY